MEKVIYDIIRLKKSLRNLESDATFRKLVDWYGYLLARDLVEVLYDKGELKGFIEYVRLPKEPKELNDIYELIDHDHIKDAAVLFVNNACAIDDSTLKTLKRRVIDKNKGVTSYIWHRSRDGKLRRFNARTAAKIR